MEKMVLAIPGSASGSSLFTSSRSIFGCRFQRNVNPSIRLSSKQVHSAKKRQNTLTILAQADSSGGCTRLHSSDGNGLESAVGSRTQLVQEPEVLKKDNGTPGAVSVGRRQALILSHVVAGAVALDAGIVGGSHPARALMQTGNEREERKTAGSATENLKKRVSTFTLDNGMKWVVLERHNAPVVSCHTYANVGAANETAGSTGLAHLLEHLAFKGTRIVGTRDPEKEAALLDQLDDVFYAMEEAKEKGRAGVVQQLNKKFTELQGAAAKLSVPNEYGSIIERQGGIGLNAQTSLDSTEYFVSLPANKLELWMALESGRFIAPVFREVYSEKEVVKEERRLRVDNTPFGRFTETFIGSAFPNQPYGRPVIGYPDDFERLGRREVSRFFQENYKPETLTCSVVGDVDPVQVEKFATRYFGSWGSSGKRFTRVPQPLKSSRDNCGWDSIVRADGDRTLRMNLPAQPLYMEGYYRPSASSSDDPALTVVNELLSGGRLSRLYKRVVIPGKALSAQSVESFPGDKKPNLLLVYGSPTPGTSTDYLANILHHELEDLASKDVLEEELVPTRKATRAGLLEAFGSNRSMAKLLCLYEATTNNWLNLFEENELIQTVSPADVQRTAALLFKPSNRFSGHAMPFGPDMSV
ncbi:zinc protease [Marchantia polymorpha subsp. ruderalis]